MSGRGFRTLCRCNAFSSQRAFSSSPLWQKHGAVPAFTETSSSELNDLLSSVRRKIMMPAHLGKSQQHLIYKARNKDDLSTTPVTATLAGEDFILQYIDRKHDILGRRDSLVKALNLMKEKKDWDNLPNLLQGLKNAGYQAHSLAIKNLILGKATYAERQDVLLECLRRVSDTGFALKETEFVRRVFQSFQRIAYKSDWHEHMTRKALKWAQMVATMMEDPEHAGNWALDGAEDPRLQPAVIGILLELAAVRAVKHSESKDVDGKVELYASRLLGTPVGFPKLDGDNEYQLNPWMIAHVPVLHGMYEALKVLEPSSEVAVGLKTKSEELDALVSSYADKLAEVARKEGKNLYGLQLFDKLLSS